MSALPGRTLWIPALLLLAACRQQVVVNECDDGGHPDASADAGTDGGGTPDSGADAGPGEDGGPTDTGPVDTGTGDAGSTCDPLCFYGVTADLAVADVRQPVTLTVDVESSTGGAWTISVDPTLMEAERAENRPALDFADVVLETVPSGQTVTFRVVDVAPWFFETTFRVPVTVTDTTTQLPYTRVAEVKIRGNVLLSDNNVYAVASDGQPATLMGQYPQGILLEQLVSTPRAIHLAPDGHLLVYDEGASPVRIKRFELTGKDVLAGNLQYLDANNASIFTTEQNVTNGFAVLPDGRVVYPEYHFSGVSGAPKSRLMLWNADGTYDREVWAPTAVEEWRSATAAPNGKLLVLDRGPDVISRFDANTLFADGTFVDQLPGTPYSVFATQDAAYIAGYAYMMQATWSGGQAAITGLPGTASFWRGIAQYEGGRLLAIRDTQTDSGNLALIENRQFVRFFRVDNAGPIIAPYGVEYLR